MKQTSYGFRYIPIPLPNGCIGHLLAGPTRAMPDGHQLIRCAKEIPVDPFRIAFDVATPDFTPFDDAVILNALPDILQALMDGRALYAGCMGGTGRTGTLLALLVAQHPAFTAETAIAYVRQLYKAGAVETDAQERQVERLAHSVDLTAFTTPYADIPDDEFLDDGDYHPPLDLHLGARIKKAWRALWGG